VKTDSPRLEKLLGWYPRKWRERYGEELLAMIEDTLDGRRPTLRLRMSVAWGGLRERGNQARKTLAGSAAVKRLSAGSTVAAASLPALVACQVPALFRQSPPQAEAGLATAAEAALIASGVLAAVCVLAGGLAALPTFGRFVRAGGWPRVRCRAAWAGGLTAAAAGGLAWLVVVPRAENPDKLYGSLSYVLVLTATTLMLVAALCLWTAAAVATARQLRLPLRVRAVEKVLAAVLLTTVLLLVPAELIWTGALQPSTPLILNGLAVLASGLVSAPNRIKLAVRRSRRLWSKAAA
jgi:hypothetical protein